MHLKESAATFSPPPAPSRKPMAKRVEQVNQPATTATDGPVSSSDSVDNINDPEGEGMQLQSLLPVFWLHFKLYFTIICVDFSFLCLLNCLQQLMATQST